MFSYRTVLGNAWRVTKQHKKLWIFGFLAFILSAGGEYQILNKILNGDYGSNLYKQAESSSLLMTWSFWANLCEICYTQPRVGFGVALLLFLLAAITFLVVWICIRSQIALVKWSKAYLNIKNKEKVASVWEEITINDKGFWRVLGLNFIFRVIIAALFLIISLPLVFLYLKDSNFAILMYTLFFIVFIPSAISLSLIIKYSIAGVVLEKQSFVKSLETGYNLFCKNWLVSLEMAILLFLINFLTSLIIIFILSLAILPIILALIIFNVLIPLYLIIAASFLVIITVAAMLMTFQTSSWTILFLELKGDNVKAKLERIFTTTKKSKSRKTKK